MCLKEVGVDYYGRELPKKSRQIVTLLIQ